ncbi:ABC transporter substrate-binding protein [Pusillimonas sp. CC-YST705]|uniref:ABC transporter substrate-binding protein n=1 Tax=Mesopusillimonas faecipullorum TaxID=2755040 RepID=A0ABS8CEL1_9BURK|nr:ABC transporter substrate-binding protein [Mesopusillimonas faecipullorum]MCB5364438.1 ABC transporter substrate-binding protein [Mesopusillimonas faecipullorum]
MRKTTISAVLAGLFMVAPVAQADITVGFSGVLSGPQGVLGQDQRDGFLLALEELGNKFGDQNVKVVIEDDQLKPDVGAQAIQKFLERDKVDAIVGLGFSNVLMAELRRIKDSGVVAIATNAGPGPVAGKLCAPNLFGLAWQNDTMSEAMGQYVQDLGHKNAYLMTSSYQAGKDKLNGFKRYFKGDVAKEVYTPLGQLDFSAEISALQAANPEALFVFYTGGTGVNFARQLRQAGIMGKTPVYSEGMIDSNTLVSLKSQADGNIYGATWAPVLNNPQSKKFVKAFEDKYGHTPSEYAANGYDAAYLLNTAVLKLNGDVSNREAFVKAVKQAGSEFPTVRGKFAFNTNNMPIQNLYAFKAVGQGDDVVVKQLATVFTDHQDAYVSECDMK